MINRSSMKYTTVGRKLFYLRQAWPKSFLNRSQTMPRLFESFVILSFSDSFNSSQLFFTDAGRLSANMSSILSVISKVTKLLMIDLMPGSCAA